MFRVFIGSSTEGRRHAEKVAELINEHPLFIAVPWWQKSNWRSGSSFFECLTDLVQRVAFGIFVATPDDILRKRGQRKHAIRDNVLFEYGLFAGFLGRHSTVLLQIGDSEIPSDLKGINVVYVRPVECRKDRLRPHVQRCLEDLLQPANDDFTSAVAEVREARTYLELTELTSLLASAMLKRIELTRSVDLAPEHLRELLELCRRESETIVGLKGHQTEVSDYIDPARLNAQQLQMLSASYARFVAQQITDATLTSGCPTRVVIHFKRDLKFLNAVLREMRVQPVVVDLGGGMLEKPVILGRCISGESAILLHDFTRSGYTPRACAAALREARGVTTQTIISFFVSEESRDLIESTCSRHDLRFRTFGVLKRTGEFELQGHV